MREDLDDRVLGAIRFVDATVKTPITTRLQITADRVRLIRNRSNLYVIASAPGAALDLYTRTFALPEPPAGPLPPPIASVPVILTITDPSGRYLPRRATISVPRDPDKTRADQPGSLFQPIDVELFPSPIGAIDAGWAILRLSVKRANTTEGLPFAYVRVRRAADDQVLARGLADERGEALVAVPGIPVTLWNAAAGGAVVTSTLAVKITAHYDRTAFDPKTNTFPDPDALESRLNDFPKSADVPLDLASGREVPKRIDLALPP